MYTPHHVLQKLLRLKDANKFKATDDQNPESCKINLQRNPKPLGLSVS